MACVFPGGRRRKRNFASHLTDLPEGLEGESAASEPAAVDLASSPARQRRRSTKGHPLIDLGKHCCTASKCPLCMQDYCTQYVQHSMLYLSTLPDL